MAERIISKYLLIKKCDIYREWILHKLSETTAEINDDGLNQLSRQESNSSTDLHEMLNVRTFSDPDANFAESVLELVS
uniref:Uncharacterized protein n=1 Tax=Meloidogyne enterolobii TaxID=390850 RepID=A0A6V7XNI9_MELEN|nr:unnamed protein product [Meloidogyne enterolobii]